MICHKCKKTNIIKNGMIKESQKYKCKDCNHQFINEPKISQEIKDKAVTLYNLGFSIPKIADLMNISSVNILNWIKKDDYFEDKGMICEPIKGKDKNEIGEEGSIIFEIEIQ